MRIQFIYVFWLINISPSLCSNKIKSPFPCICNKYTANRFLDSSVWNSRTLLSPSDNAALDHARHKHVWLHTYRNSAFHVKQSNLNLWAELLWRSFSGSTEGWDYRHSFPCQPNIWLRTKPWWQRKTTNHLQTKARHNLLQVTKMYKTSIHAYAQHKITNFPVNLQ